MSVEKDPQQERIQVLGRSVLSHMQQVFRNADLFDANNQIFVRLAQTLSNYIKEAYRLVGGCGLHVTSHQVFLEDSRVFIDSGLIESANFLSGFFGDAEIGGVVFHEECWDPKVLIKTLFAFRSAILDDKARGEQAIAQGLIRRHCPYITAIKLSRVETTMTGIRDEENARRFALRNAAKLAMFISDMDDCIQNQEAVRANHGYRVLLNLIRVNEQYPDILKSILACPPKGATQGRTFYGVILTLVVCHALKLGRQAEIDFGVAALFQCLGELIIPPHIRASDRLNDYRDELPDRALGWLLDTRFVNRSLYFRIIFAYQVPRRRNLQEETPLPAARMLRAINYIVEGWKLHDPPIPLHRCVHGLLASDDATVDKAIVLVVAKALGSIPASTLLCVDHKTLTVVADNEAAKMRLISIPESRAQSIKKMEFDLKDPLRLEEFETRVEMVQPYSQGPNSVAPLFLGSDDW